jgi:copper oxidase (laccase) domain-containing protein
MQELGAEKKYIRVAIGQGISQKNFEVGPEVKDQFINAGFPDTVFHERKLDLVACNRFVLLNCGIDDKNIWSMDRCTFEADFFSYRRDKGVTGRMWGLIAL